LGLESDEIEDEVNSVEFNKLKLELQERCKKANIAYHEQALDVDDLGPSLSISLPSGREKWDIGIYTISDLRELIAIEFEKYAFIGDYAAISNADQQVLEASIRFPAGPGRKARFLRLIEQRIRVGDQIRIQNSRLHLQGIIDGGDIKVTIGPPSIEFRTLMNESGVRVLTLRIEGIISNHHDAIKSFLERFSDSLFFQIDSVFDTPMALTRRIFAIRRLRKGVTNEVSLSFPKLEYEQAPMSLYFYGRAATGLPLVQFLAFYQVIEFYFPICYQADAGKRIRGIIKDPSFRVERDSDITRIISTLQAGPGGGYADERTMLRATLQETIDIVDLKRFLEEDEQAAQFFKSKGKSLTEHRIPLENAQGDLRQNVAERVYDIRCKIVHTKASGRDGSYELLLPYSKEAGLLNYDVDLVHYLARKVLIYASSPLKK
jgi:hypothetical protein